MISTNGYNMIVERICSFNKEDILSLSKHYTFFLLTSLQTFSFLCHNRHTSTTWFDFKSLKLSHARNINDKSDCVLYYRVQSKYADNRKLFPLNVGLWCDNLSKLKTKKSLESSSSSSETNERTSKPLKYHTFVLNAKKLHHFKMYDQPALMATLNDTRNKIECVLSGQPFNRAFMYWSYRILS